MFYVQDVPKYYVQREKIDSLVYFITEISNIVERNVGLGGKKSRK